MITLDMDLHMMTLDMNLQMVTLDMGLQMVTLETICLLSAKARKEPICLERSIQPV